MSRPIRVLVADDHELFRAGVRSLMQGFAGVEIVAEACNGREGCGFARPIARMSC